jgi:hypothetical protein
MLEKTFIHLGEVVCQAFYERSILRSRTLILPDSAPVPTVEQLFKGARDPEENE